MIRLLLYIPILTIILSSCSNFLTWHLDRGIHKTSIPSSSEDASKSEDMTGSDLSSETYKIFEFGEPCTTIGGLTGSGDQNFNTGSGATPSQVSARYLQLKITLRTDMSGSA